MNLDDARRLVHLDRPGSTPEAQPVAPVRRVGRPAPEDGPGYRDLFRVVLAYRTMVASIAAAALLAGVAYLVLAAPVYRTTVVVQVADRSKTVPGLDELATMFGDRTPADTEIEIVRSRTLLDEVVDRLGLDVEARPRHFPILGGAIARAADRRRPRAAPAGLASYAWGGERIRVQRLDVSDDLVDQRFAVTATGKGSFHVDGPDGLSADGKVGAAVTAAAPGPGAPRGDPDAPRGEPDAAPERSAALLVSELVGRPGTTFTVVKRRRADVISGLQRDLRIEEKGKKSGILSIELEGAEPRFTATVLDAIADAYVRQNIEVTSAEAAKTLAFIESQLPKVKKDLDAAERALTEFRTKNGTVDLSAETQARLDRSAELEKELSKLSLDRSELRQRFAEGHPALQALEQKEQRLRRERGSYGREIRSLPKTEVEAARLTRDVRLASDLYSVFLDKAQELRVMKSGTVGNVRVLDRAWVPHDPVAPRRRFVLAMSFLLGLGGGVAAAFARHAWRDGAQDPDEIERGTGIPVYATVPHSPREDDVARAMRERDGAAPRLVAALDPSDAAVENLRSLHTSLQFALVDARTNVVTITAPSPDAGKSFLAANLGYVLASAGKRVVVVDCDLRRGRLHRYFRMARSPGLSELVSGAVDVEAAARRTEFRDLDLIATGRIPPNPAELLRSDRFHAALAALAGRYDLVVVDTPPILAVTDAAIIAREAGVNLLVLRAGRHPLREIALSAKRLARAGTRFHGAVLNDVRVVAGRYGRYGRYYSYEYRPE